MAPPPSSPALPIGIRIAGSAALQRPEAVEVAARAAEDLGYAAVWIVDGDPEVLMAAGTLAAYATERIRIGMGILVDGAGLVPSQRMALPWLSQVAPGRLTLGIAAAGLAPDAAARVVASVRAAGAPELPAPRVVLSASTPDAFDLVARAADGWLADGVPVAELSQRWADLQVAASDHGRAGRLALVVPAWVALAPEPLGTGRPDYQGDVAEVGADVIAAARSGAEEVVLMPAGDPSLDELLDLCAQVAEVLESALVPRRP